LNEGCVSGCQTKERFDRSRRIGGLRAAKSVTISIINFSGYFQIYSFFSRRLPILKTAESSESAEERDSEREQLGVGSNRREVRIIIQINLGLY